MSDASAGLPVYRGRLGPAPWAAVPANYENRLILRRAASKTCGVCHKGGVTLEDARGLHPCSCITSAKGLSLSRRAAAV